MAGEPFGRSEAMNMALQYLLSLRLSALKYLVENHHFYTLQELEPADWVERTKRQAKRGRLPTMFQEEPLSIIKDLGVRHA